MNGLRQTVYLNGDKHPKEYAFVLGVQDRLPSGTSWAGVFLEIIQLAMEERPEGTIVPNFAEDMRELRRLMLEIRNQPRMVLSGNVGTISHSVEPTEDLEDDAFAMDDFS